MYSIVIAAVGIVGQHEDDFGFIAATLGQSTMFSRLRQVSVD